MSIQSLRPIAAIATEGNTNGHQPLLVVVPSVAICSDVPSLHCRTLALENYFHNHTLISNETATRIVVESSPNVKSCAEINV